MPSGTDAYHINGNALLSVLYLPVGTSKCLPLHDERLKEIQETFSNSGLLFIDENSMTGQKHSPWSETASRRHDQTTRTSHLGIYLGDVKQLPPICDSLLFKENAVDPSGYNTYQIFDNAITFTELVRQQ